MKRDERAIQRVLWLTLGLNLLVAGAKLAWGLHAGILSMVADGIHSSLDGANNIVGIVALAAARQPPDAEHPYGHRKFETFASLAIGAMLMVACWEIVRAAFGRALTDISPVGLSLRAGVAGWAIMLATLAVNAFVSWYEAREGRRHHSEFLVADSAHTRADLVTSLAVMAALGAATLGFRGADLIVAVVIVAWIVRLSWKVVQPAMAILADEARVPSAHLAGVASSVRGVTSVHRIRTRGTPDHVFADLHVQVAPDLTVAAAHAIAHDVENAIRAAHPGIVDVTVHVEPEGDPEEDLDGTTHAPATGAGA